VTNRYAPIMHQCQKWQALGLASGLVKVGTEF